MKRIQISLFQWYKKNVENSFFHFPLIFCHIYFCLLAIDIIISRLSFYNWRKAAWWCRIFDRNQSVEKNSRKKIEIVYFLHIYIFLMFINTHYSMILKYHKLTFNFSLFKTNIERSFLVCIWRSVSFFLVVSFWTAHHFYRSVLQAGRKIGQSPPEYRGFCALLNENKKGEKAKIFFWVYVVWLDC